MKRTRCLLITLSLALALLPSSYAETVFEETFDLYSVGQPITELGEWKIGGNAKNESLGSAVAESGDFSTLAASTTPKSAEGGSAGTSFFLHTTFPEVSGKVAIELDVLVQRGGAQIIVFPSGLMGKEYALKLIFRPAPEAAFQASKAAGAEAEMVAVATYQPGEWYHVKITADLAKSAPVYSVELTNRTDGTSVGSAHDLRLLNDQASWGRIALGSIFSSQAKALWDNLRIQVER